MDVISSTEPAAAPWVHRISLGSNITESSESGAWFYSVPSQVRNQPLEGKRHHVHGSIEFGSCASHTEFSATPRVLTISLGCHTLGDTEFSA